MILLILLMCCSPIMASSLEDKPKIFSLTFPMTTIDQMKKYDLSPVAVGDIVRNGTRLKGRTPNRYLYVHDKVGVVVDFITGHVINIVPSMCLHEFQKRQDAKIKKDRMYKK